jgi:uncharacterized membrane protein (DUF2068 family)
MARTRTASAIRLVAFFEAFKGAAVLLAATGLLALVHHDLAAWAASLVQHTHLNPASRYPRIFLDAMANLQHTRLVWLALGAAAYSAVRFAEAYGLYRQRPWAEWLAALSGGLYIPFEVAGVIHERTALSAVLLVANAAVVAVMMRALIARR